MPFLFLVVIFTIFYSYSNFLILASKEVQFTSLIISCIMFFGNLYNVTRPKVIKKDPNESPLIYFGAIMLTSVLCGVVGYAMALNVIFHPLHFLSPKIQTKKQVTIGSIVGNSKKADCLEFVEFKGEICKGFYAKRLKKFGHKAVFRNGAELYENDKVVLEGEKSYFGFEVNAIYFNGKKFKF